MATISKLDRVAPIVLRYTRRPIFVLIGVYAIGITGMVLIPGQDSEGQPGRMTFFHAFYFLTYTATTTGFGELPSGFSEGQRLWAVVCLYLGIIAWLYAIGSIFRLARNPNFTQALAEWGFARSVRRIRRPFVLICGFGDTGSLLTRGLSDSGYGAVILDGDPERIKALALRNYRMEVHGLAADPSMPKHLLDAGLTHHRCLAVVALTGDEHANLKIAVMARFLSPGLRIISRSSSSRHQEELAMLESVDIVDPFQVYAHRLSVALHAPALHALTNWLVGAPNVSLTKSQRPPMGHWIICGYGRMGKQLHRALRAQGLEIAIIDPDASQDLPGDDKSTRIFSHTTDKALHEAGITRAAGIMAATDSDSDNLSILLRGRALNPRLFLVVRQNRHEHEVAFNAAAANLIMQPSLVAARRVLLMLVSPALPELLTHLESHPANLERLLGRLSAMLGARQPHLWVAHIDAASAGLLGELSGQGHAPTLGAVTRDPRSPQRALSCVPLALIRDTRTTLLPEDSSELRGGDACLFCGSEQAERLLDATLHNPYTLRYLITGQDGRRLMRSGRV